MGRFDDLTYEELEKLYKGTTQDDPFDNYLCTDQIFDDFIYDSESAVEIMRTEYYSFNADNDEASDILHSLKDFRKDSLIERWYKKNENAIRRAFNEWFWKLHDPADYEKE